MKALLVGLLVFLGLEARAIRPEWRCRRLRGPHFDVIYNEKQRALADHFLVASERAHELVYPLFGEGPERTLVILQDDTDESNGEANFLPYPHIRVYPVLPSMPSGLGEYSDWALELMVHEYTHILNMYPAHGFYTPLKYLFGSIVRPNAVLPKWYLEGLAVATESIFTTSGRLRTTETRGTARALALALGNGFERESITTINEQAMLTWPYGNRPYLFGGWWWETSLERGKTLGAIGALNVDFARRLPFLLNGPMRRETGRTPREWFEESTGRLRARAERELARLRETPSPPTHPVAEGYGEQRVFAISPSGRSLVYWFIAPTLPGTAFLKTRRTPAQPFTEAPTETLFRARGTTQARWLDETHFVYDMVDPNQLFTTYRDLYVYDVEKKTSRRLTEGLRAEAPAPSPSGRQIAFLRNDGGRNSLFTLDVQTGERHHWIDGNFSQRLGAPEFRGEREIVFSLKTEDGRESLRKLDLDRRQITPWLEDRLRSVTALRRVREGFVVTDAGTGVRNAYLLRENATGPEAITNTQTHVGQVDLDPQTREVIYDDLTVDGHRLKATPLAAQRPASFEVEQLPPAPPLPRPKIEVEDRPYEPWRYLLPRYWIPAAYQVENGLIFQGLTSHSDPIGRNRYDLMASFDTITHRPSYGFEYVNSSLPTRIGLGYQKAQTYLGASNAILQNQSAHLDFSPSWPFRARNLSWNSGVVWLDTTSSVASYRRVGPRVSARYSNLDSPLGAWHGFKAEAEHRQYLALNDTYAYGRTAFHLTNTARLGRGHRLSLEARGVFSPKLPFSRVVVMGERNVGGNYAVNLANSDLMMRGYPSANFVGRKVENANLEYSFPLVPLDAGVGTFPLFLRNLEIALFLDAIAVDGGAYESRRRGYQTVSLGKIFAGTGTEFRFNTTVAYHAPLQLNLGLYYGIDRDHGGGFSPFVAVSFGGLEGLRSGMKTP